MLPELNKALLARPGIGAALMSAGVRLPKPESFTWAENFLTFGEGNFLRTFVYGTIDEMNRAGTFRGRGVAIQSVDPDQFSQEDPAPILARQDCLYTTVLHGMRDSRAVEERTIVASMSRVILYQSPGYWREVLAAAASPTLRLIFSQTTEAGIRLHPGDTREAAPAVSFPAKLALFLEHRFKTLGNTGESRLVIVPTELNYRSGDLLNSCVGELSAQWKLGDAFNAWMRKRVVICNSVVDSIVTGKPDAAEAEALYGELGYRDGALSVAEPFKFWVIEDRTGKLAMDFPVVGAPGITVRIVNDLENDHKKKMRILCGAHTAMIGVSFLAGNDTVRASVEDPLAGRFIENLIYDEACPSIDGPAEETRAYADAIVERFRNPFTEHKLLTLSLNITAKVRERLVSSILDLCRGNAAPPPRLVFAFAGYIAFMQVREIDESGRAVGYRNPREASGESYPINDRENTGFFHETFQGIDTRSRESVARLVAAVLRRQDLWGEDLCEISDGAFARMVGDDLGLIFEKGMRAALREQLEGERGK